MKTKIGLPLGLALVMFIGVFTTMLALGVFSPQPASAAIDTADGKGITVKVSDTAAMAYADWTISFENDDTVIDADTNIVISITNTDFGGACASDADTTNVCDEENWAITYDLADDPGTTTIVETAEGVGVDLTSVVTSVAVGTSPATITLDLEAQIPGNADVTIEYTQPEIPYGDEASPFPAARGIRNGDTDTVGLAMVATVMVGLTAVEADGDNTFAIADAPIDTVVSNDPTEPGVNASFVVSFTTFEALPANASEIVLRLDKDILGAGPLPDDRVSVRFTNGDTTGTGTESVATYGYQGSAVPMKAPRNTVVSEYGRLVWDKDAGSDGQAVAEADGDRNIVQYTFTVPDMNPGRDDVDGIPGNSRVDVTFGSAAGLRNPTESGTLDRISVSTTNHDHYGSGTIDVDLTLYVDDVKDKRDTALTITGKGYENDTTATIWLELDNPGNSTGVIDDDETVLLRVDVGSDDTFEATINVSAPPFEPGNVNYINARDTEEPKANWLTRNLPRFNLDKTMRVSPSVANVGDTVRIEILDHTRDEGTSIPAFSPGLDPSLTIGGVPHWPVTGTSLNGDGNANFDVVIANDVTVGTHEVRLRLFGSDAETKLTVGGATLIVSPATVVPNQSLSVQGRGFGGRSSINSAPDGVPDSSLVSIAGSPLGLKAKDGEPSELINRERPIVSDNGGNWSANIKNTQTHPTCLLYTSPSPRDRTRSRMPSSA